MINYGPVLGVLEDSEYQDERYTLAPGDAPQYDDVTMLCLIMTA